MDLERWKVAVSVADIVTKSAIAIGVACLAWAQNTAANNAKQAELDTLEQRERFNRETTCWNVFRDVLTFRARDAKSLTGDQANDLRTLIPASCTAGAGADPNSPAAQQAKALSSLFLALLPAPTDSKAALVVPTEAPGTQSSTPAAWVAVGFLNTPDFNFTLPDDAPLTTVPKQGEVLLARWSVNIRPQAAAWGQTVGILAENACFKVAQTRTLGAGALTQIWAGGTVVPCPAK